MTEDRLPLAELLAKAGDGDFLRSVAETVLQMLMEATTSTADQPSAVTRLRMAYCSARRSCGQLAASSIKSTAFRRRCNDVYELL